MPPSTTGRTPSTWAPGVEPPPGGVRDGRRRDRRGAAVRPFGRQDPPGGVQHPPGVLRGPALPGADRRAVRRRRARLHPHRPRADDGPEEPPSRHDPPRERRVHHHQHPGRPLLQGGGRLPGGRRVPHGEGDDAQDQGGGGGRARGSRPRHHLLHAPWPLHDEQLHEVRAPGGRIRGRTISRAARTAAASATGSASPTGTRWERPGRSRRPAWSCRTGPTSSPTTFPT